MGGGERRGCGEHNGAGLGVYGTAAADPGIGVKGEGPQYGVAGISPGVGVYGQGTGTGTALQGVAVDGPGLAASSATATAVQANASDGTAVYAASMNGAVLHLDDSQLATVPPTSGSWSAGQFLVKAGSLWFCSV